MKQNLIGMVISILCFAFAQAAYASDTLGQVTNLPIPRYVSMKAAEGNVRRGPSLTHRIDWVFKHKDMPLRITAEYGHWRRVEDFEGVGGWMHHTLLSGVRTVVVLSENTLIRKKPISTSVSRVVAEAGAILKLGACEIDWCEVSSGRYRGWLPKQAFWGADLDEIR